MNISRIIANTVVRRLTLLALAALLAWFGFGDARAQDYSNCANYSSNTSGITLACATQGLAYIHAAGHASARAGRISGSNVAYCGVSAQGAGTRAVRGYWKEFSFQNCSTMPTSMAGWVGRSWPAGTECPNGVDADSPTGCVEESCPAGAVRMANGNCSPTPEQCEAINNPGSGFRKEVVSRPLSSYCVAGCVMSMAPGTGSGSTTVNGATVHNGEFRFTGGVCGQLPPEVPEAEIETVEDANTDKPQECVPAGAGQTACVKRDGNICHTASTGKQICWQPGEVGEKGDGPVLQVKNPGNTPIAPALTLPTGDTISQQGTPVTATTTKPSGTITTTTTNYITTNGTNAKPGQSGQPSDGTGTGTGNGDGDGTASGGQNCESPPIVSGDAILGMVANQAWHTRCAVDAGNAAKVTGDVGDCNSPFTVEGTNANAVQLRAMRAQICGENQPGWTKGEGPEGNGDDTDYVDEQTRFGLGVSPSMLDQENIFGGGGCPAISGTIYGKEWSTSDIPAWCQIVAWLRAIILVMGAWTALNILMGRWMQ